MDQVVQERTVAGRKPYTLRVKAGGEIAGRYPGKNAWDAAMRTSVPRMLDMSVLSWKEQSPDAIAELREHLDCDFEYTCGLPFDGVWISERSEKIHEVGACTVEEAISRGTHCVRVNAWYSGPIFQPQCIFSIFLCIASSFVNACDESGIF
jgi:hypothetical protein